MDAYLITIFSLIAATVCGILIGWHLQNRRYQRLVSRLQIESGDQSLQLLETRKHLRTISGHLKTNLTKDQTIRHLKRKQKSLLKHIDRRKLQARRKEKAHYIEMAKLKLELIETKLAEGAPVDQAKPAQRCNGADADNEFGRLNDDLQKLLKQAGVQRVRQLASLSRRDIERLSSKQESMSAE